MKRQKLDRTVIDEISDPLMHLLHVRPDHGLESSEERIRLGKDPVGSIFLMLIRTVTML